MKNLFISTALFLFGLSASLSAHSSIYSDDVTRCLVANTSNQDKTDFVRWIFAVYVLHPDIKNFAIVSEVQRADANRVASKKIEHLLTEVCKNQVIEAIRYEGPSALQASFQVLGQVAAQELMTNAEVRDGFRDLSKYIDESKFKQLVPAN